MTDKEKTVKELKEALDSLDITNKYRLNLIRAIEYLQEEPVSKEIGDYDHKAVMESLHPKLKEEPASEDLGEYINELSKQFPEVSFAKLSRIAVSVSRWQQNQDVKNKQPKVTNRTELDEYAYQCAYDMSNDWVIENPTWHDVEDACKLGANWQKKQDQETIELAEDHAMLAGIIKGTEHTIGNVRSILNKVAYKNNGLDVNGDYCEQPYVELDDEFRKLLKEG